MPRIRYMKHEFFLDENLANVSSDARLLAAGLPCIADKAGRLEDRPLRIKALIFPYHEIDASALLQELHDCGFITRYTVDDKPLIQIANFESEQKPHPKEQESTLPALKLHGKPRKARTSKPLMGTGIGTGNGDSNGDGIAPPFHGERFLAALAEFEQHRKESNKTLKDTARKALYSKLESYGEEGATRSLRQSVENSWTGVFPPRGGNRGPEGIDAVREVLNELEH